MHYGDDCSVDTLVSLLLELVHWMAIKTLECQYHLCPRCTYARY